MIEFPSNLDNASSDELLAIIKELQYKVTTKKKAEAEAERLRLSKILVYITVTDFKYNDYKKLGYVSFKFSKRRDDIIDLLHNLKDYSSVGGESFTLGYPSWNLLVQWANQPENNVSEIRIPESIQAWIQDYLTGPDYFVDIDEVKKNIIVKYNIKLYSDYRLTEITGNKHDQVKRTHSIPYIEGWRVYSVLLSILENKPNYIIKYTDRALAFLKEQLEKRNELLTLVDQDEYEPYMNLDLNGIKPKDYQSVGARFAILSGGRCLIADPTGLGKSYQALLFVKLRMMGVK